MPGLFESDPLRFGAIRSAAGIQKGPPPLRPDLPFYFVRNRARHLSGLRHLP